MRGVRNPTPPPGAGVGLPPSLGVSKEHCPRCVAVPDRPLVHRALPPRRPRRRVDRLRPQPPQPHPVCETTAGGAPGELPEVMRPAHQRSAPGALEVVRPAHSKKTQLKNTQEQDPLLPLGSEPTTDAKTAVAARAPASPGTGRAGKPKVTKGAKRSSRALSCGTAGPGRTPGSGHGMGRKPVATEP